MAESVRRSIKRMTRNFLSLELIGIPKQPS